MRKYKFIFFIMALIAPLALLSCSESDDTVEEFPDWQNRNETFFADIYSQGVANTDGTWKVIRSYTLEDTVQVEDHDHIVVKVLREGTGSGCPMYSDSVMINYRGHLLPSTSYPEGYVFDQSFTGDYNPLTASPATLYVGGTIDGFTTALQYMHIGDYWRIYIPYQLGYRESGSGSVPGYSTLVFDVELVAYYRAGETPLPWRVAPRGWVTE